MFSYSCIVDDIVDIAMPSILPLIYPRVLRSTPPYQLRAVTWQLQYRTRLVKEWRADRYSPLGVGVPNNTHQGSGFACN